MPFIDELKTKAGLNVTALKSGTKLIVETQNSFYEMEVLEGKEVMIYGGTKRDGTVRFPKPVKAIVRGSNFGGSVLKVDWIGVDMCVELSIGSNSLTTSAVERITIESPDGKWSYQLNKDDQT